MLKIQCHKFNNIIDNIKTFLKKVLLKRSFKVRTAVRYRYKDVLRTFRITVTTGKRLVAAVVTTTEKNL